MPGEINTALLYKRERAWVMQGIVLDVIDEHLILRQHLQTCRQLKIGENK